MGFEARVVPFQLTGGVSSGTFDVTSSGFGTPQAAIVVLSGSTSDSISIEGHEILSVGMTDGTRTKVTSVFAQYASSFSDTARAMNNSLISQISLSGTLSSQGLADFNSFITDGIRIGYVSGFPFSYSYRGYVILLKGADNIRADFFAMDASSADIDTVGFKPDIVLFASANVISPPAVSSISAMRLGAATRGSGDSITQAGISRANFDNSADVDVQLSVSSSAGIIHQAIVNMLAVDEWRTSGFGVTRTGSGAMSANYLAIKLPTGQEALCGLSTTPTSTGNKSVTTDYSSGTDDSCLAMIFASRSTGTSVTNDYANSLSVGACDDAGNQAVAAISDDDASSDSVSVSAFLDSDVVLTYKDGYAFGSPTVHERADMSNIASPDLDLNFTTASSDANYFVWLAIQKASSSTDVTSTDIATDEPFFTEPAVGQTHVLASSDIATGQATVDASTLTQTHVLISQDVATGSPTLGAPTVSISHDVESTDIATDAPIVSASVLTQVHTISSEDIATGQPELGTPTVSISHDVSSENIQTGSPTVDPSTFGQTHVLTSVVIATDPPSVGSSSLTQTHVIASVDISTDPPTLGLPTVSISHSLTSADIITGLPIVDSSTVTQTHVVTSENIATGNPLFTAPTVSGATNAVSLDIETGAPTVDASTFSQTHLLTSLGIEADLPTVDASTFSQTHLLTSLGIETDLPTVVATDIHTIVAEAYTIADAISDTGHGTGLHFHAANEIANQDPPSLPIGGYAEVGGFFGSEVEKGLVDFLISGQTNADAATITFDVADISEFSFPSPGGLFGQDPYGGDIDVYGYPSDGVEELAKYSAGPETLLYSFSASGLIQGQTISFDATDFFNELIDAGATHFGLRMQAVPEDPDADALTFENFSLSYIPVTVAPTVPFIERLKHRYKFERRYLSSGSPLPAAAIADFTWYQPDLDVPLIVFMFSGVGGVSYLWDFNGEGASSDRDPEFLFSVEAGTTEYKAVALTINADPESTIIKLIPVSSESLTLETLTWDQFETLTWDQFETLPWS